MYYYGEEERNHTEYNTDLDSRAFCQKAKRKRRKRRERKNGGKRVGESEIVAEAKEVTLVH